MKTREETVLATYTLQLIGPDRELPVPQRSFTDALMHGPLREAEENITDMLPQGYSVRIGAWDE